MNPSSTLLGTVSIGDVLSPPILVIRIADVGNSAVGWCGNAETGICRAEYATKVKIENGVNPEYYALIKVSDLEEVDNLPDDYGMIEELDKVCE